MRILLDTNIIIYREDPRILNENMQTVMKNLNDLNNEIIVHPLSIEELKNDQDTFRRESNLSKVNTYSVLENPPSINNDILFNSTLKKSKNFHDYVDNSLLYAIYKNAASFLITEDKEIHKKALKIGVDERVLSIEDALNIFKIPKRPITPPAIYKKNIYNLDINDKIFDSLKEDYPGSENQPNFEEWFEQIKLEGRDCLVYYNKDDSLGALLIYKDENEDIPLMSRVLPQKNRLKISTLIVSSKGNKIGEFFIQWATNYAIKKNYDEIYLTHFTKPDDYLVQLIEEYGFFNVGKKNNKDKKGNYEDVFVKYLNPTTKLLEKIDNNHLNMSKTFYPKFYDGKSVKKFVVSIYPEYHEKLFIGTKRQSTLFEHSRGFIIEGNAIKKAYLSHSNTKKISSGDIILFYRTGDKKAITCIGIAEKIIPELRNPNEIIKEVGKRTVYSPEEIKEFANSESSTLVIWFIFSTCLPKYVKIDKLKELKVLSSAPQNITEISHDAYLKVKNAGGINGSFTIN